MHLITRELAYTDTLSGETRVFATPRARTVH